MSQETAISSFSRSFNIFNNNNFVNVGILKIKVVERNVNKMVKRADDLQSKKKQTVAHLAVEGKPAASLLVFMFSL